MTESELAFNANGPRTSRTNSSTQEDVFENITSEVSATIRNAYLSVVAILRKQPWLAPVAILAVLLVVS